MTRRQGEGDNVCIFMLRFFNWPQDFCCCCYLIINSKMTCSPLFPMLWQNNVFRTKREVKAPNTGKEVLFTY